MFNWYKRETNQSTVTLCIDRYNMIEVVYMIGRVVIGSKGHDFVDTAFMTWWTKVLLAEVCFNKPSSKERQTSFKQVFHVLWYAREVNVRAIQISTFEPIRFLWEPLRSGLKRHNEVVRFQRTICLRESSSLFHFINWIILFQTLILHKGLCF